MIIQKTALVKCVLLIAVQSSVTILGAMADCTTGCNSQCNVPPTGNQLDPGHTYNVCADQTVTGRPNGATLQAGIGDMVEQWNSAIGFQIFAQGCGQGPTVSVTIGPVPDEPNESYVLNPDNQGGTITIEPELADQLGNNAEAASTVFQHATGHLLGLGDASTANGCTQEDTVMFRPVNLDECHACDVTPCDNTAVDQNYSAEGGGGGGGGIGEEELLCADPHFPNGQCSPIVLAVGASSTYELTNVAGGVRFDLNSDGVAGRLPWTAAGEAVGLLALDRNHNGIIDNGRELFGNFTPLDGDQAAANGFDALAYWDRLEAGGNGDVWIDGRDAVWAELLLWIDANHDGLTQPGELFHPSAFWIQGISLAYMPEMRQDQHGNLFRYRSEFVIGPSRRMCYDVFLGAR